MVIAERSLLTGVDRQPEYRLDHAQLIENRNDVMSLLESNRSHIPNEVWDRNVGRINKAFSEFETPTDKVTSAFFVHTRRLRTGEPGMETAEEYLDDSSRTLDILHPRHGISEKVVEDIWGKLPPRKVGEISGTMKVREISGKMKEKDITTGIFSVPVTPTGLDVNIGAADRSAAKRGKYARPRIYATGDLAIRMGAQTIGLGETLAALTWHGKTLQERFDETKIVTGHNFTAAYMEKWAKYGADQLGVILTETQVTIIGAAGSIGTAMTDWAVENGIGFENDGYAFVLHDVSTKRDTLERRADEIGNRYPELKDKIKVVTGDTDEELKEANSGSRIILIASSAPKPFIRAEHLDEGSFVVNDSQPPAITLDEAKRANSKLVFVTGQLPEGMTNDFDYGLIDRAEWSCALEVLATDVLGKEGKEAMETSGAVNRERVKKAKLIIDELGMDISGTAQAWGEKTIYANGEAA